MKSLYRAGFFHLASLWRFDHLCGAATSGRGYLRCVMLLDLKHEERLATLEEQLHCAEAVTSELMADVMANGCVRLAALGGASKAKLNLLIEASAWTDAAMALLELELPQWKLRRLVKEDGEWFCSLSKQPEFPIGYDDVAEANHDLLPLALLLAFVQARRATTEGAMCKTTVPQVRPVVENALCCDNFA
jgi:hypothetical protein